MITSSWESPLTTHNPPVQLQVSFHGFENSWLVFHGSMSAFICFQGLRLVFQGSRSVFMCFQGSRLVFRGSRLVFQGSRWVFLWFFIVPIQFLCFQVGFSWFQASFYGFSWFQVIFYDLSWFQVVFYGSRLVYFRAERRRREVRRWEHPKSFSLDLYLGPTIPLGLAGRRPALA